MENRLVNSSETLISKVTCVAMCVALTVRTCVAMCAHLVIKQERLGTLLIGCGCVRIVGSPLVVLRR